MLLKTLRWLFSTLIADLPEDRRHFYLTQFERLVLKAIHEASTGVGEGLRDG